MEDARSRPRGRAPPLRRPVTLAGVVGRATIVEGLTLGLVWPASGVSLLWYAAARRRGPAHLLVALLLFGLVTLGFAARIDMSWQAGAAFVVATVVQVVVATALLRRFVGTGSPTSRAAIGALSTVRGVLLGAVQMGRLIDDLLTHVSAHGQVLELEPIDLTQLAHEVADAHGVGEALTVGELPDVWADRALVHQLVTNLVGNAAKYRHPDRPLAIGLSGHEQHGLVTLVLEDNGSGIPDADRDRVFERFYRVDAHRELGNGTGLGLAMCRTIVERHGGTIRALPRAEGTGAAIELTLAAVPPPAARPAARPSAPSVW